MATSKIREILVFKIMTFIEQHLKVSKKWKDFTTILAPQVV